MRLSELFTRTLRDAPADAELANHKLAIRAGLVRPVAAGIYALMPLGWRVIRKIEAIIRDEMEALDGQEVHLPVVHPAELWQQTGRWDSFGPALQKFETGAGRGFVLGPTHEEVIAFLAAREIDSYKQLPQHLFQIQTKYRDEPRARGGLVRLREFTMKDAYSLHTDEADLERFYAGMVSAYARIFARVGVPAVAVEADSGAMGGQASQEFMLVHEQGEDTFVVCDACGYAANVEAAQFVLPDAETPSALEQVRKVATPDCTSIQAVADFIGVPTAQTLKAVFFMHSQPGELERFVFGVIRGDLEINETKLINALGGGVLRPATDDEILAVGAVPGYASPLGLGPDVLVIADRSVQAGTNFVAGANESGYHLIGVNVPRDFDPAQVVDLAAAFDGATCARCGSGHLHLTRAIELGHCFKLGTRYSDVVGVFYQDEGGTPHPVVMGSYGIGLERLLAAIIETHHDDWGIVWPAAVAPFDVHIVTLGKGSDFLRIAADLYAELRAAGVDVLLDDRAESPGVKFADADLIGVPLRITVSPKAWDQGGFEVKRRDSADRQIVAADAVLAWVRDQLDQG